MNRLPNIWLGSLTTFESVVKQIDQCLLILKENAQNADFTDSATKKLYGEDVVYMKQFFERAEMLARKSKEDGKQ